MPVPISRDAVAGTKTRIKKIIERLATIHPDAKPDLDFSSALELLIALILAAQARDDLIRKITPGLFKKYRTAEDYAKTSLPELQREIGRINFYRNKSRSIHNCCSELVEPFVGNVPDNLDVAFAPWRGTQNRQYPTRNAFGQQTIGVDTRRYASFAKVRIDARDRSRHNRSRSQTRRLPSATGSLLPPASIPRQRNLHS